MSRIVAIIVDREQSGLRGIRPAWEVIRVGHSLAYYREDHNTPWIDADGEGHLTGGHNLTQALVSVDASSVIKVAFVELANRESVEQGLQRAAAMRCTRTRTTLTLNSAAA